MLLQAHSLQAVQYDFVEFCVRQVEQCGTPAFIIH